ncbi:hypothetical protein VM636_29125 [Streptomyces sp. SCSIO 75703]|uniref:hypothetical protein n=1 Tax=Streptomyces sp. SCSIO 75703 TaxID=3112165 RepID=UPI0030D1DE10
MSPLPATIPAIVRTRVRAAVRRRAPEFAAPAGPGAGEAPPRRRRGPGRGHRAPSDAGSPYRRVLSALLTVLPPATRAGREAVAKPLAEGPPGERAGLDPYGALGTDGAHGAGEFATPARVPRQAPGPTGSGRP